MNYIHHGPMALDIMIKMVFQLFKLEDVAMGIWI
jgi:hypothetical protein